MSIVVVKANPVPVRALRLKRLVEKTLGSCKGDSVGLLEDGAYGYTVVARGSVVAEVWRKLLDDLAELTRLYAEIARVAVDHGVADAVRVLRIYADILAYSLRWPLYLHPLPELGITSPHIALLVAKLLDLICPDARLPFHELYDIASSLASGLSSRIAELDSFGKLIRACRIGRDALLNILSGSITRILSIASEKLPEKLELILYTTPADIRLGANASPIILHDLLASGIAAALLGAKRISLDSRIAVVARLAALLHDVGKPLDYTSYTRLSRSEAKRLLSLLLEGLRGSRVEGEAEKLVDIVVRIVEHQDDVGKCEGVVGEEWAEACEAVVEGDRLASGFDSLSGLILSCIDGGECSPGIDAEAFRAVGELLLDAFREAGVELGDWKDALREAYRPSKAPSDTVLYAWSRLYEAAVGDEDARSAVRRAMGSVLGLLSGLGGLRYRPAEVDTRKDIGVLIVDIDDVQKLIRESSKLRTLSSMSISIDYVTMVGIPLALEKLGVPLEAVVFAGGAVVQAIVPGGLASLSPDELRERIEEALYEVLGKGAAKLILGRLAVHVGASHLARDKRSGLALYGLTVRRAYRSLAEAKMSAASVQGIRPRLSLAYHARLCTVCGERPALFRVADEEMCAACYARYYAFGSLGFRARRQAVEGVVHVTLDKEPINALTTPRGSKIAVVKADGNAMGVFMLSSLTPSVYFEKSVRIDLALKRGIREVYTTVYAVVGDVARRAGGEATGRVAREMEYLGAIAAYSFMYAGGDDALLILPHEASLAAALLLAYTFAAETGFQSSLSVGVAAGPREQPIWWLIEAAEALLESAKEVARIDSLNAIHGYPGARVESGGAILYDYLASGALTGMRVEQRLRERWTAASRVARLFGRAPLPGLVLIAAGCPQALCQQGGINLFQTPPRSLADDERVEEVLRRLLQSILEGGIDAGRVYRGIERIASTVRNPRLVPWVIVERIYEAGGELSTAYRSLLRMLAGIVDGGVITPDAVSSLISELYLVSKLLGG